jgi:hypothetical protein
MTNGTLLRARNGSIKPFIIIDNVIISRHLVDHMVEIYGYKVARCDRMNHPFIVDKEDFFARFEVLA